MPSPGQPESPPAEPSPIEEPVDVLCRDGGIVRVRPLGEADAQAIVEFYHSLDEQSLYRRFMTHTIPPDDVLLGPIRSTDERDQVLGVETAGRLVGIGLAVESVYESDDCAEVAFAVHRSQQGRGIGTILLEHLAAHARATGRTQFVADTLTSNLAMIEVFEAAGFRLTEETDAGDVRIRLTLDDRADRWVSIRDRRSHAASVRRLLHPETIAVVGASRDTSTVGHALFRNLVTGGFAGTVYPVNLKAPSVLGVTAYPSVADLPAVPDLVVLAVPSPAVRDVLKSCGELGVFGVVVVSAGFAETAGSSAADSEGAVEQDELLEIARWHGMRLVGPNCVGIVNAAPDVRMNATFSPAAPTPGTIGFASQSGALGIAALDHLAELGLGVSSFVSLGNKADISGNDLLQYWQGDDATLVIALYLESFGNPRKFAAIASDVCRTKPIVAVKAGRSASGARAASSHTAAMTSSDDVADALFREAGITRVTNLADLFDVSRLLASQPLPEGRNIAIVGNSGGPGILAADACEAVGLSVPALSEDTQERLRSVLLPGAGVSNPVDLIAAASAEHYEQALTTVLADDAVDGVIVIYTDPMVSEASDIAAAISRAAATSTKPIAANFLATDTGPTIEAVGIDEAGKVAHPPIPVYDFPEPIAAAFGHAAELGEWRRRQDRPVERLTIEPSAHAAEVIGAAEDGWLPDPALRALLGAWGIEVLPNTVCASAAEASAAAEEFGYPVALKLLSDTITHKTDVGGVVLGLETARDVAAAFDDMAARLGDDMTGALVQRMAEPGVELIAGTVADPVFGPVLLFGAGGTTAEVWNDRAVALAPLARDRAEALIDETRVVALLRGHRGAPPCDLDDVVDVLVRLGALADRHREVRELDLNPIIVTPNGVQIVDARCRIEAVDQRALVHARQLD